MTWFKVAQKRTIASVFRRCSTSFDSRFGVVHRGHAPTIYRNVDKAFVLAIEPYEYLVEESHTGLNVVPTELNVVPEMNIPTVAFSPHETTFDHAKVHKQVLKKSSWCGACKREAKLSDGLQYERDSYFKLRNKKGVAVPLGHHLAVYPCETFPLKEMTNKLFETFPIHCRRHQPHRDQHYLQLQPQEVSYTTCVLTDSPLACCLPAALVNEPILSPRTPTLEYLALRALRKEQSTYCLFVMYWCHEVRLYLSGETRPLAEVMRDAPLQVLRYCKMLIEGDVHRQLSDRHVELVVRCAEAVEKVLGERVWPRFTDEDEEEATYNNMNELCVGSLDNSSAISAEDWIPLTPA